MGDEDMEQRKGAFNLGTGLKDLSLEEPVKAQITVEYERI
jgi:hypothetical protein